MEQTLGKRIAENRRKLKLTQDQLAEKLGITAQAVSKWENDLSCPDITMLPRLAEIFGITTDALLGVQTEPAREAELVVTHEDPTGVRLAAEDQQDGQWEFHWDSGKRGAVAFAMLMLITGVLTILSRLMNWNAGFWSILWPTAMLVFGVNGLIGRFSFFELGLTAFGCYFLVKNLGIWEFSIAGELIFPIIVVLFGISLLADALKKPNKSTFRITHNGKNKKTKCHCLNKDDCFSCELAFGENTHAVSSETLRGGSANVSFGELTLDLTGCESAADGCTIEASCSFGTLTLLVPKRFRLENSSSTAFASVEVEGHHDPDAAPIGLDANVSFGQINIQYI